MDYKELVKKAIDAKKVSYSPYSHFCVGAALLTKEGKVFQGCNIESASYTPSNCAERTAFFKAVSEGERNFTAIAIAGSGENAEAEYCYPCGVCRQVMVEFCDTEDFVVIVAKDYGDWKEYKLAELIPHSFGPKDLGKQKVGD